MSDALGIYVDKLKALSMGADGDKRIMIALYYQKCSLAARPGLDQTVLLADVKVCLGDIVVQEIRGVGYVQLVKREQPHIVSSPETRLGPLEEWRQAGYQIIHFMKKDDDYETMVGSGEVVRQ